MLRDAARSLWHEPRVPDPPVRVWRDWALVVALIPVVVLTRRRDIMGPLVNRGITTAVATVVAGVIVCLNAFLLFNQFFG